MILTRSTCGKGGSSGVVLTALPWKMWIPIISTLTLLLLLPLPLLLLLEPVTVSHHSYSDRLVIVPYFPVMTGVSIRLKPRCLSASLV